MQDNSNNFNINIMPTEELENGEKLHVSIGVPMSYGWMENMRFEVIKGNELLTFPMRHKCNKDGYAFFDAEIFLETRAIYHYYFSCDVAGKRKYFKKENINNIDSITFDETYKLSVNYKVPDWAKGKVMYHIFVDRFCRGSLNDMKEMPNRIVYKSFNDDLIIKTTNQEGKEAWNIDFYGGDLKGIEKSLDYIQSLGVTILYLSPIVWSQSNHRYDAADYLNVDPYAGCNEDLKALCESAHKRGMKVVLDAVFNHTGNDSKYFNEYGNFGSDGAFNNPESLYYPFYKKHYVNGHVKYDYWWGMTNLPVCDGNAKEWKQFILGEGGVIDFWFSLGIDGLRLDVADELTDEFIEEIRKAVKRNKEDGFILGEVWKNPMRMGRGYIESGKGMDSVMNYSFIDALLRYFKYGDVTKLAYIIRDIKREYPDETIYSLMNFTSTHDITRAINLFGCDEFQQYGEWYWNPIHDNRDLEFFKKFKLTQEQYERGREIYEAYIFALTFFPGIMSIFYGDEVGLQGLGNLANRKPFPWNNMDMRLLELFRYVGKIRSEEKFLETAELNMVDINQKYLMFERIAPDEQALITINRTGEESSFMVPHCYRNSFKVYSLKKSLPGHLTPYGAVAIKKM